MTFGLLGLCVGAVYILFFTIAVVRMSGTPLYLITVISGWAIFIVSSGWLTWEGPFITTYESAIAVMGLHIMFFGLVMMKTRTSAFDMHRYGYIELSDSIPIREGTARDVEKLLREKGGVVIYVRKDMSSIRQRRLRQLAPKS